MMKVVKKVDVNLYQLYDVFENYMYGKKYSQRINKIVHNFYEKILNEVRINEKDYGTEALDIIDVKWFYVTVTKEGKINKLELDWECFVLYNLVVNYFDSKSQAYPKSVCTLLKELEQNLKDLLIISGEYVDDDVVSGYIEQEIIYDSFENKEE